MNSIRKVIAKRMAQSKFTAPHIYFFNDVDMEKLLTLREEILTEFEESEGIRISINDFLIKAVALTLREFPLVNSMVSGEEIRIFPEINVGLAVAMEDGLIVPAIQGPTNWVLGKLRATGRISWIEPVKQNSPSRRWRGDFYHFEPCAV